MTASDTSAQELSVQRVRGMATPFSTRRDPRAADAAAGRGCPKRPAEGTPGGTAEEPKRPRQEGELQRAEAQGVEAQRAVGAAGPTPRAKGVAPEEAKAEEDPDGATAVDPEDEDSTLSLEGSESEASEEEEDPESECDSQDLLDLVFAQESEEESKAGDPSE
eukprot:CAMPEP_0204565494 /NCGR_PEP_ID=MMETSP0661-20131031/35506_1 /ASSEMBLY_ACC=CAM_ASM_000606 /TAXON_ID=109239 /ORGANISM="Alexandrium margalefi, Strain AMGDE01CS-322" /LENGTH=162 /DNA_ID=CAMNT_0051573247 /DNA_START=79 /DNA_END=568 /DNA_ORIENTATION=+